MTIAKYSRQSWQDPAKPITGPASKGGGTWVIHYPGGGTCGPGFETAKSYNRQSQAMYLNTRGYSLGYSFNVMQDGGSYAVRGMDLNNAANSGKKVEGNFNAVSKSINITATGESATTAAIHEVNRLIQTQPTWDVVVHGDVDYTSCCGPEIIAQVRAGIIGQSGPTSGELPPVPVPPPVSGYNPPTNWSVFPLDPAKPTIRKGSTGAHVRYVQDVIFYYGGGDILVDGIFGSSTEKRVKDAQRFVGGFPEAYCDGIVGNHATYPSWKNCFDYLVALNTAPVDPPAPIEPPESDDVVNLSDISYYVEKGDSPWSVATTVYGTGSMFTKLDESAFVGYSTPSAPVFVVTPGISGTSTLVRSGEGANALIRRLVKDDAYPTSTQREIFATWNGGYERSFHPGDLVHIPSEA